MEKKRRRKGLLTKKQKHIFYQKIVGLTTGKFSTCENSIMAEESKKIPQTNNNVRLFLQHPPII
ncbi:hypothetical protein NC651_013701 [Populus alba x Populus x berolinensis]|nr:hypothetical protein NC651_013701 [Populus alba x Populus x berolinensis]